MLLTLLNGIRFGRYCWSYIILIMSRHSDYAHMVVQQLKQIVVLGHNGHVFYSYLCIGPGYGHAKKRRLLLLATVVFYSIL